MTRILKLFFSTDEGTTKCINIYEPKENLEQDEVKQAMEAIVASTAFAGIIGVVKALLYTSDRELVYEA